MARAKSVAESVTARPGPRMAAPGSALQEDLKSPLYHQIYLILHDKIRHGEYADRSLLPSEFEIARTYGVSRITAKRALNELAAAGLAVREQGRGTRVTNEGFGTIVKASVHSLQHSLRSRRHTRVTVLEFAYLPANEETAAALGLHGGDVVQRAVRVSAKNGLPYSHLTTYVPSQVGQNWSAQDMERLPLVELLARAGHAGVRGEQIISATLADGALANALQLPFGAPLLKVSRTIYDWHDRAVEYLQGHYPPGRYQFSMSFTGNEAADGNE